LALDEPKEEDTVYNIEGFQYVVNNEFLEKVKPIKVDFSPIGFRIDCGYDFGSTCGSCSC
jgi:iron-sulfur cluster assembly protein